MTTGHTVVLAVDDSEQAQEAFKWYAANLRRDGDKVVLVHGMEIPRTFSFAPRVGGIVVEGILEQASGEAKRVEEKFKKLMTQHNVEGTFVSEFGDPGAFVVEKAKKEEAKCIIMGTRGMGTIRRTVLGSVSDYVLHHAHCPVLVYRK